MVSRKKKRNDLAITSGGRLAPWIVAIATIAAYSNSFSGPFVFDDIRTIEVNPSIRQVWRLDHVLRTSPHTTSEGRPLVNLSLALNFALDGSNVTGYHIVNLAIHITAALLLLGVARRTLAWPCIAKPFHDRREILSGFIALVWALHPLQTESVTYIAQRAESFAAAFQLASLYCMIRGAQIATAENRNAARSWYVASVVACLAAVGSKETAVVIPLIVLAYDRVFVAPSWRGVWSARKWLHTSMFATWFPLAALVAVSSERSGTAGLDVGVDAMSYFQTQWVAIVHYLRLAAWPDALVLDYGTELAPADLWTYLCGAMLVMLAAATAWGLYATPPWGWLGLCFFAALAPSSSLVPVATQTMAEHRMYLALAPIAAAAVLVTDWSLRKWFAPVDTLTSRLTVIEFGLFTIACITLAARTHARNADYRSALRLFETDSKYVTSNPRTFLHIGMAHAANGDHALAAASYDKAILLRPDYADALANRGNARFQLGDLGAALSDLDHAIELKPDDARALNTRGGVLQRLGRAEEAMKDFCRAIESDRTFVEAYNNRASAHLAAGEAKLALTDLDDALRLRPDFAAGLTNRGNALAALGEFVRALRDYNLAIELQPDLVEAYYNRGALLAARGDWVAAVNDFTQAIRLRPNLASAYLRRGESLAKLERHDEAWRDVEACRRFGGVVDDAFVRSLPQKSARDDTAPGSP